jgi:serine/threonine protein kinase
MMMMIFYCSFRNKIQNADSLSRTLQKLHESWLVLRDIKPPNILLDR